MGLSGGRMMSRELPYATWITHWGGAIWTRLDLNLSWKLHSVEVIGTLEPYGCIRCREVDQRRIFGKRAELGGGGRRR
jgi:hypothetical protein